MSNETTNAVAIATPPTTTVSGMTALQLCTNMPSINALGQTLAQSGFFGKVSASTATAAVVNCFLEGLTPLQYKAKYHTFDNGQTGVKCDFIQREFHRLGGEWDFVEWNADVCEMKFTYRGKTLPMRVTLEEFKTNGVAMSGTKLKDNWAKFPREMLKARCMATAIRAICPEAVEGMYTQEEVADFAQTPTPATVTAVSPSPLADSPASTIGEINYAVCPCGSVKGKLWTEIPTETLEKILATPSGKAKALTAEHRNAIIDELSKRETVETQTQTAEEPPAMAEIVDI